MIPENQPQTVTRVVDNEEKIVHILTDIDGIPIDLTGKTVTFRMVNVNTGTVKIADSSCTIHPTTTFTANASTDLLTSVKHKLKPDDEVILSTSNTLPNPLAISTRYFVLRSGLTDDAFKVSATKGGTAVDITDTGTGTHQFAKLGSVSFTPSSGDMDTAGVYAYYFNDDSTPPRRWPYDGAKFKLRIIPETEDAT